MSDRTPFELNPRPIRCEEWEALLADALDGALTDKDRASFDRHAAECSNCSEMFVESQKGQQWLQFLHPEPPIPAGLLGKIISRTSGTVMTPVIAGGGVDVPRPAKTEEWKRVPVSLAIRRFMEPRMMMTAAMAFFSIALTLNMAGVRFTGFRAQDLRPSSLVSNLQRQFYTAKAPVVRYYENLRVVYEVESRMHELRRTSETEERKPAPQPEQQKPATPNDNGGSARKNGGKSESPRTAGPPTIFAGRPLLASLQCLPKRSQSTQVISTAAAATCLFPKRADQAERSLA